MRQIFASPRIENVEAVARLLEDAGIATSIRNGRGWKGAIRGNFSYRHPPDPATQPSVWIVRSEDQTPARALLREHGLLQDARLPDMGYLPPSMHGEDARRITRKASRINLLLVAVIALVAGLTLFGARRMGWWSPAPSQATTATAAPSTPAVGAMPVIDAPQVHRVPVPPMLAETLVSGLDGNMLHCLAIDSADPAADSLHRLQAMRMRIVAASQCPADATDALQVDVLDYRTDGSGSGTVRLRQTGNGNASERDLQVRRIGTTWTVLAKTQDD